MKINEYMEATFDPAIPPAPRPTCGTCPHWERIDPHAKGTYRPGVCHVRAPVFEIEGRHALAPETDADWFCGQHPGMAAWIRDEWPKVKR